jgi:hypothetical protein
MILPVLICGWVSAAAPPTAGRTVWSKRPPTYILEYKLDQSLEAALEQIRQKKYYRAAWALGKPVVGVGVNFSSKTKNIEGWTAAEMAAE